MLQNSPQKKGVVNLLMIITPRKPNSARRIGAKSTLAGTQHKKTICFINGGNHTLKKFSTILIQGRGARDLPGVYCRAIRGVLDFKATTIKKKRRSLYGVKLKDYLLSQQRL